MVKKISEADTPIDTLTINKIQSPLPQIEKIRNRKAKKGEKWKRRQITKYC